MDKNKKIVILIGDGMSDYPVVSLGNRTPLEAASTPNMDFLAREGLLGLIKTVPEGMKPGSDIANLSIFGYDPEKCFTGRAPLEAVNMGIELGTSDVAFRCNIVAIENDIMKDFSAGHIDSALSKIIIDELGKGIPEKGIRFYPGVSYRNIMVWKDYPHEKITDTTPPHDFQEKKITDFLPKNQGAQTLMNIMQRAGDIIKNSEKIQKGRKKFKGNPISVWLWGGGRKPGIKTLKELYGLYGHTISAVDLIHGIGRMAGLEPIKVEGATGYIDTNYAGKADALLHHIKKSNFIFLHVESPDESGHEGNLEHKMRAIEDFDKKVVGPVFDGLKSHDDFTLVVMPDHPTPLILRTHTPDPVPFIIYRKEGWDSMKVKYTSPSSYSEAEAAKTGLFIKEGHRLIELILNGKL